MKTCKLLKLVGAIVMSLGMLQMVLAITAEQPTLIFGAGALAVAGLITFVVGRFME